MDGIPAFFMPCIKKDAERKDCFDFHNSRKDVCFMIFKNFILLDYVVVAMNFPYEVPNFSTRCRNCSVGTSG